MGWSPEFVAALGAGVVAPGFILRRLRSDAEPGDRFSATSHSGPLAPYRLGAVRVEGQSVTPRTWDAQVGAFAVELVGDPREAYRCLPRGTIVELVCVIGDTEGRIAAGMVRTIRGDGPSRWIECLDLLTALRGPLDVTRDPLFSLVTATTTTTAFEAVASGTYDVADTTGFQRETSGIGAFKVVSSVSGLTYYRLWSAAGATTFTISDASDASVMGTTDTGCLGGDAISEVAYIYGHPCDIVRKVLTSTGAGTNGAFDLLPEDWSVGLLADLVDSDDIDVWERTISVASGSYVLQTPVVESISDPLSWLLGVLSPLGIWITMRQGQLTVRCAQDLTASGVVHTGLTITLAMVVEVEDHDSHDVQHDHEYESTTVRSYSGTTVDDAGTPLTLPGGGTLEHDASAYVFENQSAIRTEAAARMVQSDCAIPERIVLRLRGLLAAQLCAGDVVTLDLWTGTEQQVVWAADQGWGNGAYVGASATVQEVSPDWLGGTVRVALWVYPTGGP